MGEWMAEVGRYLLHVHLIAGTESVAPSLRATHSVVSLAQHLTLLGQNVHLVLLACGEQLSAPLTAPAASCAGHGAVLGLGRVLRLEHAEMRVSAGCLARDSEVEARMERIVAEISRGEDEHEVAWSHSRTLVSRLRQRATVTPRRRGGACGGAPVALGPGRLASPTLIPE